MIASISASLRLSMVCRQPDRATFRKWMICGTTLLSDASWTWRASSRWPAMKPSSDSRSSGPDLLECTAVASTTISPTCPCA